MNPGTYYWLALGFTAAAVPVALGVSAYFERASTRSLVFAGTLLACLGPAIVLGMAAMR